MNVLETANILLDYYTPYFIQFNDIEHNECKCPYIRYQINDIKYSITMRDSNIRFPKEPEVGNTITLYIYSDEKINNMNTFTYKCNEIERLDILKKMDKVSKDWYKNYIERIRVPIPYENDRKRVEEMVKGVEIVAPSDLV